MAETLEYWRGQFEKHNSIWTAEHRQGMDCPPDWFEFITSFKLLEEYSATVCTPYDGVLERGWLDGLWAWWHGVQHATEVHKTLTELDHKNSPVSERTVANLLQKLAKNLGAKVLAPNDDLNLILQVIQEKTGQAFINDGWIAGTYKMLEAIFPSVLARKILDVGFDVSEAGILPELATPSLPTSATTLISADRSESAPLTSTYAI